MGKGKIAWWKAYQDVSKKIIKVIANVGTTEMPTDEILVAVEQFNCLSDISAQDTQKQSSGFKMAVIQETFSV